jgi:hypothetical protein
MAVPMGPWAVSDFEVVRVTGIVGDTMSSENIMYVMQAGTNIIVATYYPELVSLTVPLWRFDIVTVLPTLWGANGGFATWTLAGPTMSGNVNLPCPFDVVVDAGSPGAVTLFGRDPFALGPVDSIPNITETAAFLTPIPMTQPANGSTVASNNLGTGEPVEYVWPPVPGATAYDVVTSVDPMNPATFLAGATTVGVGGALPTPAGSEISVPLGTLVDGQDYWWRVRVATTGFQDHTGPFSAWHTYTVGFQELEPPTVTLLSPAPGATGVSATPTFSWSFSSGSSAAATVSNYHFDLATDAGFSDVIDAQDLGTQQTYVYVGTLDESTTYHWRIIASGSTAGSAWISDIVIEGVFTIADPEPEPTPPVIVQPGDTVVIEEHEHDTPGWVWVLIVIGAVLAVVVIVLIVRTRRPV